MQNLNKNFASLDEFISECIKMCPIVDVKDNVVFLKQVFYFSKFVYYGRPKVVSNLNKTLSP